MLGAGVEYETKQIKYTIPASKHVYTPDFVPKNKKNIFIEVKGYLKASERKKHLLIKEQHPTIRICFIFGRPNNKIYKKSPTTYADWCEKHGFEWCGVADKIPEGWIK